MPTGSDLSNQSIEPIFVLGSPRSGTTMLGALVSTLPGVINLQEYGGFYFTRAIARREYERVPTHVKSRYLSELREHATSFARKLARERGGNFFCDTTPWNMEIADELMEEFPRATFIATLRNYKGVIQSLRGSFTKGWMWAGPTDIDRARIWVDKYTKLASLPKERLLVMSYDGLCRKPAQTLSRLANDLDRRGLDGAKLDVSSLMLSHATSSSQRTPLAQTTGTGVRLRPIAPFDASGWSEEDETMVSPLVSECREMLLATFPYAAGECFELEQVTSADHE